ncbi:hypothetical protein KQH61_03775 [bacterium]|nr:hypothetical protein [bacterium]MCB2179021.1 hypothetical protein [bacterium]
MNRQALVILLEVIGFIVMMSFFVGLILGGKIVMDRDHVYRLAVSRAAPVVIFGWYVFMVTALDFSGAIYSVSRPAIHYLSLGTFRAVIWDRLPAHIHAFSEELDAFIGRTAGRINGNRLRIFLVILPGVGTVLLLWGLLHSGIWDYFPVRYDDVDYWREISSFVAHGFNSGQYSINEKVAPLEFFRFGPHGPGFPVFYGLIGKVIGWRSDTAVWINLVLMTLAIVAFLRIVRPDQKQLLVLALFVLTFWPIWLYLPRNMQEGVHLSFGVLVAAFWVRQLAAEHKPGKWLGLLFLTIGFLSLIRFTWAILFVGPLVLLWQPKPKWLWLRWVLAGGAFLASGLLFVRWSVPWVTFSFHFLETLKVEPFQALVDLLHKIGTNLTNLFYAPDDGGYVIVFRYQMVLLVGVLSYIVVRAWKREEKNTREAVLNIWVVVVPIFLFVIALNDVVDTRDYRNLAPHFLIAILLLIMLNRHKLVYLMILLNLVAVGAFGQRYLSYQKAYSAAAQRASSDNFAADTADILEYDPAGNRWCNSLLVEYQGAVSHILVSQIDPGFGIGSVKDWDVIVEAGLKSKFVFIDPDYVEENYPGVLENFSLDPLAEFSNGILYENMSSACE